MTTPIPDMPSQQARAASGADPRGRLVWDEPLPPNLQAAEDATQAADLQRWLAGPGRLGFKPHRYGFTRPASDTERLLLEHLGYGPLPAGLETVVTFRSLSVRHRRWPQIEGTIPS
jgi:hypothetical protein